MTLPGKATHQQTRGLNRGLVLRTLYDYGPVSRAEVARLTGLTRTTVSELVADVDRRGPRPRGRPRPVVAAARPRSCSRSSTTRGSSSRSTSASACSPGALVNLRGEVRATEDVPADGLRRRRRPAALTGARRRARRARRPTGLGPRDRRRHPRPRRRDDRDHPLGGQPRLADLPLGRDPQRADRPPGQRRQRLPGRGRSPSTCSTAVAARPSLIAVKVGLGIGAGIVIEGEVFNGDGFGAGEIGHTVIVDDGAECRCGRFGCLETVASSRAIVRAATEAAARAPGVHARATAGRERRAAPRGRRRGPRGGRRDRAPGRGRGGTRPSGSRSPPSSARSTSAASCCWAA